MNAEQIICEWLMKIDKDLSSIGLSLLFIAFAIVFAGVLNYFGLTKED